MHRRRAITVEVILRMLGARCCDPARLESATLRFCLVLDFCPGGRFCLARGHVRGHRCCVRPSAWATSGWTRTGTTRRWW